MKFNWSESMQLRMDHLWTSGDFSDLTLLVGPCGEEFKVHRAIVSTWSSILEDKIKSLAQRPNDEQTLIFECIQPEAMRHLLKFIYTGEFDADKRNFDEILDLFKAANFFQFTGLVEKCSGILKRLVNKENVLEAFDIGMKMSNSMLIGTSLHVISENAGNILKQENFQNLSVDCIFEIVKQDDLEVDNEVTVFNAVFRWGEAECQRQNLDSTDPSQIRTVIEKFIQWIRFPMLSQQEFKEEVMPKQILGMEDMQHLLLFFMTPESQRSTMAEQRFISTPRGSSSIVNQVKPAKVNVNVNPIKVNPVKMNPVNPVKVNSVNDGSRAVELTLRRYDLAVGVNNPPNLNCNRKNGRKQKHKKWCDCYKYGEDVHCICQDNGEC